jgi:TRAP-type mannitol/chloroaromatic compound transport system substrate-binding protein
MDRRSFLKTTGSVAAVAGTVAPALAKDNSVGPAVAAPAIRTAPATLTVSTNAPDTGRGLAEDLRRLCLTLNEITAGDVRLQFSPDALRADADIWFGPAADLASAEPALGYFEGLPGTRALSPSDLAQWVAFGGGQMLWDDVARAHGTKPLLAALSGSPSVLWSTVQISEPSSFRKLRVAASGLSGEVIKGLGGQCVDGAPCTGAGLLDTNSADAVEFGGAMHGLAHGFAKTAKFAVAGGIARQGSAYALHIKQTVWALLPRSSQLALEAVSAQAYQESLSEARLHDRIARDVIAKRHGLTLTAPSSELANTIAAVSDAVVAHAAASSRTARRIDASYSAFKALLPDLAAPAV